MQPVPPLEQLESVTILIPTAASPAETVVVQELALVASRLSALLERSSLVGASESLTTGIGTKVMSAPIFDGGMLEQLMYVCD